MARYGNTVGSRVTTTDHYAEISGSLSNEYMQKLAN